jgi:hexosaminidase
LQTEGLKDEHELQSYFIKRIEKHVNARGKIIIGWDEILEGGLAPNAAVMSWRGTEGGIAAAKAGHYVVMSPGKPCYFDHYQSKKTKKEPLAIGGFNPLDSVYAYEPLPAGLTPTQASYILGAQGNVWTEYMPTFDQVTYMALPRMAALAEVLWTYPAAKDFEDFKKRWAVHQGVLDEQGYLYFGKKVSKKPKKSTKK